MAEPRVRREPPRFRAAEVLRTEALSPRMVRVTVGGPELEGLDPGLPAASVRLLLPSPESSDLVLPTWNGNEFLAADGSRPVIRTLTPRLVDTTAVELTVDVVIHEGGPLSDWARAATEGSRVAVSGTGRGHSIDPDAAAHLLAGDESAIPAISQLLESIPAATRVDVVIEVGQPDARMELPDHAGGRERWFDLPGGSDPGDALVAAVVATELDQGTKVWAAGEAAAMQRIRKHLFEERRLDRSSAVVRGYWKRGRSSEAEAG